MATDEGKLPGLTLFDPAEAEDDDLVMVSRPGIRSYRVRWADLPAAGYPPLAIEGSTVTDPAKPYFDVRRYGALGDGTTDDTTAFRAAVDAAAASAKGGDVIVPPSSGGFYLLTGNPFKNVLGTMQSGGKSVRMLISGATVNVSKQVTIPGNTIVEGNGRLAARLQSHSSFIARVNVSSVTLASNVVTVVTSTAHGLEVGATVRLENVTDAQFNGGWQVASVPSTTSFTFALTAANTTSSGGTVTIPFVALGDVTPCVLSCRLSNLAVFCANVTNSVGVYSNLIDEHSGCENVLVYQAYRYSYWIERSGSTANITGPLNYSLKELESIVVPDVGAIGLKITGTYGQHRGVDGFTHTIDGASGEAPHDRSAAAIDISGAPGVYSRIHCEFCTDGIIVGSRAGSSTGYSDSAGIVIQGVTGQGSVRALVRIKNAAEIHDVVLMGLAKLSGTNILVDEKSSTTLTDDYLGFYALSGGQFAGATKVKNGRLTVEWSTNVADGIAFMQSTAGLDSPRLFLGNSADGTSASLRASGNALLMSTGGVPGTSSGTLRALLSTTELGLQSGVGLAIGAGTKIAKHVSTTGAWDPGSLASGAQATTTMTVTGAALGDTVLVSFNQSLQGMQLTGYVSAADTVTVVLQNGTGGAIDLASGTLRADVWQH